MAKFRVNIICSLTKNTKLRTLIPTPGVQTREVCRTTQTSPPSVSVHNLPLLRQSPYILPVCALSYEVHAILSCQWVSLCLSLILPPLQVPLPLPCSLIVCLELVTTPHIPGSEFAYCLLPLPTCALTPPTIFLALQKSPTSHLQSVLPSSSCARY